MDFILLIVFLLSIWGLHFRRDSIEGYINPAQTSAINGIFVMIVFMRHINQYLTFEKYDSHYQLFDIMIGQLLVTTFLFYSGYGIMYSLMNKDNYIKTMPKRIVKILLQFDFAIILYLIVTLIIHQNYSLPHVLLSFVAWESLGNSNWYIFAILYLYAFTFIAGIIFKNNRLLIATTVVIGGLLYILFTISAGKGSHWYNTILCYPAGMFYAIYSNKINDFFKNNRLNQILSLFIAFVLFWVLYVIYTKIPVHYLIHILLYELVGILFVLTIIAFTTLFVVSNPIITWFGKYLFEIYILQRIPMLLLDGKLSNKYIYFGLCFGITLILSILFKYIEKYLNKIIDMISL